MPRVRKQGDGGVAAPEKGMRNAILLLLTIAVAALQWAAFRTEALPDRSAWSLQPVRENELAGAHEGMSVMHSWKWGEAE